MANLKINYKGKSLEIIQLPNGKFKKPNVAQFTTSGWGGTWLDDARIPFVDDKDVEKMKTNFVGKFDGSHYNGGKPSSMKSIQHISSKGRFPANVLVSDDSLNDGKERNPTGRPNCLGKKYAGASNNSVDFGDYNETQLSLNYSDSGSFSRYFDLDAWQAQFLIVEKASKSEKNAGLHHITPQKVNDGREIDADNPFQRGKSLRKNTHPTVKPISLMSYLITMGSREGDTILDPFAGSGTTLIAATLLKRNSIGIELDPYYYSIMKSRLDYWKNKSFEKIQKIKKQAEKKKIVPLETFL